ncbi:MAG: hypothetical protein N2Z40_04910 [Caldimicrobium sp.]|nr:hypothetical protein [Caldimicrobium sp.]
MKKFRVISPFEIRGVKTIMGVKFLREFMRELEREGNAYIEV